MPISPQTERLTDLLRTTSDTDVLAVRPDHRSSKATRTRRHPCAAGALKAERDEQFVVHGIRAHLFGIHNVLIDDDRSPPQQQRNGVVRARVAGVPVAAKVALRLFVE